MTDLRLEAKLGFDRIRRMIAEHCITDYACSRVENEEFCTDEAQIRERLALTDEMRLILMFEENFPTSGYIDTLPLLEPLEKEGWSIDVLGIGKLKTMLDTTRKVTAFFASIKDSIYPRLSRMSAGVHLFPEVSRRIETIIDRYGEIKDSASDNLNTIRRELRGKEAELSKRATAVLKQAQSEGIADPEASVVIREGKFLIPVATSSKRKLAGFVYGESSTGKTTFIEPSEVVALENDIMELKLAQNREIALILRNFTDFLRPYVPELMDSARFCGEIDFLMAKAGVALDIVAGVPVISRDGLLALRKARHPLLQKALEKEGRQIVPLSLELNPGKRILLISGPNAGGKSVCLKTAGLLQYMFQWGMLIPTSETSELPIFRNIAVSIGDDQSLENDLSTYSSFLSDMKEMLASAGRETLVLIDEFGSGTEPAAGGAIAEAILAELDRKGVYGVITTHYTNLKLYASNSQCGVINGAMLFDSSRIEPLFKLQTGLPGNSFAFELARKMHLPENIVHSAEEIAGSEYVGMERNLRRIAHGRKVLDEKIRKIKATDKNLENLSERYQKELEEVKSLRQEILDKARAEAEEIVLGARKQVEKTIRDIKEAQAEKQKTQQARSELQGFVSAIERKKSRELKEREQYLDRKLAKMKRSGNAGVVEKKNDEPLKVGEKVRIKDNGMVGEVSKISGRTACVTVGNISTSVTPDRLERISSNEYREQSKKLFAPVYQKVDSSLTERKLSFSPEIDVRGQRLADAMDTVARYIDDAIMLAMGSVRIIHGKGTGVLREELQKFLRTVPGVASVSDEDIRQGGTGVTIVKFD